ncbi:MAG: methylenetetrahydrofolate reductase [NAD(P)H] [Aureliella sp.]|jgi:methylenetetrahydrofolate reductase (NADPH)
MQLAQFYAPGRCALSFELFPPKTEAGVDTLLTTVGELMEYAPDYMTCTYGAGGSTRDRTLQVATAVRSQFGIPVASHLTCVGSTRDELRNYLRLAHERGVDYIVALRGDPPKGETTFKVTEGGLRYANELVALIREEFGHFGIAVAGYPEVHQECASFDLDLANLKRKVDSGADIVITQLFYDNADFFRFRDACERLNIDIPIVPGILPVTNLAQIKRITSLCKARLPESFVQKLGERDDEQWQFEVGVEYAQDQVRDLINAGVPGVHFYVLNKSSATNQILAGLNGLNRAA